MPAQSGAKPTTTRIGAGLFALVFLLGAVVKFDQYYTGHFSRHGFFIGIVLGMVITGAFWWFASAAKQPSDEATRRGNRMVTGIWAVAFLFMFPLVLGFTFP
jgi:hypothetical protein